MTDVDAMNAEVTTAILEAERLTRDAYEAWKRVEQAERQLAERAAGVERDIAQRGAGSAIVTVAILEALTRKQ